MPLKTSKGRINSVSGTSLVGDVAFSLGTNGCTGVTLDSNGGTCTVPVNFAPTVAGSVQATVTLRLNGGGAATVLVTGSGATRVETGGGAGGAGGTGTGGTPLLAVSSTSLAFGSVNIGGTVATKPVTVKNLGTADLIVSSATMTGDNAYSVSANTCGTVAPNGTCSITVSFLPTTAGAKSAALTIANNAPGGNRTVLMTGTGASTGTGAGTGTGTGAVTGGTGIRVGTGAGAIIGAPAPVAPANVSLPAALDFGAVKANANKTMAVTVTNPLTSPLKINFINTTGGAFNATRGGCPVVLGAGKSCRIRVTFKPTVPGKTYTGKLKLSGNMPMTMSLSGIGRR